MSTPSHQLSLTRPEWFQPVPPGSGHYVPVLQSQPGERDALARATPDTWEHMTPLIEILGPKEKKTKPFTHDRVRAWVKKVADAVGDHACFVDTLRFRATDRAEADGGLSPVLEAIYAQARKRGMQFVPVLRLSDSKPTVKQIREAAECDGRGVAIRYPILVAASVDGRGPQTLLKEALDSVGVDVVGADLVLDLGFLQPDVDVDPAYLQSDVEELLAVGDWRSVVLVGTAMHRSLGGGVVDEGTVGRLPRREWDLWLELRARRPERIPTYGDYAIQHPDPPWEGEESGPGMRANIRYTLDDVTVVPRGTGPVVSGRGAEQYRDLCQEVMAEPKFAGPDYTWGDRIIFECAHGLGSPGNQNLWRGAGTSHHLRHVVEQLAGVSYQQTVGTECGPARCPAGGERPARPA